MSANLVYSDIVQFRINVLQEEREECTEIIQQREERIKVIDLTIQELHNVRDDLDSFAEGRQYPAMKPKRPEDDAVPAPPKPSAAIRQLLAVNPDGLESADIANVLQDQIETKSENKRNIVHTTLYNMKKSGRLIQDDDGKYRLPESNGESE